MKMCKFVPYEEREDSALKIKLSKIDRGITVSVGGDKKDGKD